MQPIKLTNATSLNKLMLPSFEPVYTDPILSRINAQRIGGLLERTQGFLSQLLPYDPSSKSGERLKDGLNEYLLLLIVAEEAMVALKKGEFARFDPLVGENACQIRAVKIALIARNWTVDADTLLDEIQKAKKHIEHFLAETPNFSNIEMSLMHFLERENIDVEINDDAKFLIKSFILTKTKVVHPFFKIDMPLVENASTDSKKIKEILKVGSSFSGELVKGLRKRLSAHSVDFIQEIAEGLNAEETSSKMLTDQYTVVHNGLKCLPYYWATRVLMNHALSNEIPIVMLAQQMAKDQDYKVVNNTQIYFLPTPEGYKQVLRSEMDPNSPAIVLIGSTCRNFSELPSLEEWVDELLEKSPIDLVLAYAAAHRQYPDESKDAFCLQSPDTNFQYHRKMALQLGCSLENPSRFFLTHAFCDQLQNIDQAAPSLA
jgi:hypothetical protein